jgi:DHA3 family multidrug efflux protein-like MFS transporter
LRGALIPYGIDLFGVQGWGIWFAVISTGFIIGGVVVAAKGLGRNPIRTILLVAAAIGAAGALSTIREWGWLYIAGVWLFMALMPAAEAAEQTIIQRLVPYQKQGHVFGFAMTFEAASAPITALLVAPLAELWVIPYMRTGEGQGQWEWLLGTGDSRGIALILVIAGLACAIVALAAFLTPQYRLISTQYETTASKGDPGQRAAHDLETEVGRSRSAESLIA